AVLGPSLSTSTLLPYTTLFRSLRLQRRTRRPVVLRHLRSGTRRGKNHGLLPGHPQRPHHSRPVGSSDSLPYSLKAPGDHGHPGPDRKSTRLNSSHVSISYAVFC